MLRFFVRLIARFAFLVRFWDSLQVTRLRGETRNTQVPRYVASVFRCRTRRPGPGFFAGGGVPGDSLAKQDLTRVQVSYPEGFAREPLR